jgi:Zn-dependent protease with chaperone function
VGREPAHSSATMQCDIATFRWQGRLWVIVNAIMVALQSWLGAIMVTAVVLYPFGSALPFAEPLRWSLRVFEYFLREMGLSSIGTFALWTLFAAVPSFPHLAFLSFAVIRALCGLRNWLQYVCRSWDIEQSPLASHATFLAEACSAAKVPPPRIVVVDDENPKLFVCRGLWRRHMIVVSKGCLAVVDARQLRSLLAHEIGHLARDASRLAWLKALSQMMLLPGYYLTVLYDFSNSEREADIFALRATGDSQSLKSALASLSVAAMLRPAPAALTGQSVFGRIRAQWRTSWLSIVFTDSVLGAAYPSLQERLAWIDDAALMRQVGAKRR